MSRFLIKCLVGEILTLVFVAITFVYISNTFIAGMVAGALFIVIGVFVCSKGGTSLDFRKSVSFMRACVHLVLTLTMVFTRILHPEGSFESINFWGISGVVYHHITTWVYIALIAGTAYNLIQSRHQNKGAVGPS